MYKQLESIINRDILVPDRFWEKLKNEGKLITLRKNEYLLEQGEICRHGYFLNKGCLIQLFQNKNGKEVVMGFFIDNYAQFFTSPNSYFNQIESNFEIKAIEDCELIAFSKDTLEFLANEYIEFSKFYHKITATALHNMYTNNALRLSLSADKYLIYIMKSKPEISKRIPDKYIARFIGVSSEWVCKMKKKILNQKKNNTEFQL